MAAPLTPAASRCRAPITARRRPRPSMWLRHTFGTASLPAGAGIPAATARGCEGNR
jgi:hypothetical protein